MISGKWWNIWKDVIVNQVMVVTVKLSKWWLWPKATRNCWFSSFLVNNNSLSRNHDISDAASCNRLDKIKRWWRPESLNENMDFSIILSTIGTTNSWIYYQLRDIYCICNVSLRDFLDRWHLITSDKWILSVLQRVPGTYIPWSASYIISFYEHIIDTEPT
jgi:hypothetical protein